MRLELEVTSIRVEKSELGWRGVRLENGREAAQQDFAVESDALAWADAQRILSGNFLTQNPAM